MSSLRVLLLLLAGSVITTGLGFAAGNRWLLPVLGAAVPYILYLRRIRQGRPGSAWAWVLAWALIQSGVVIAATLLLPERAGEVILRGPAYAQEMLHWVRTGEGPEGSPRLYLPVHLKHYLAFAILSVLTAGAGALVLGTALLNYMNYYVAELVRASANPALAALFGWPIWAVLRVVGFVATGTALTVLSLSLVQRLRGRISPVRIPTRILGWGVFLVLLDAVLKAVLASPWRRILLEALGSP
jgi:hypothetical protein